MDDKPATSMDTANKDLSTTDATTSSLNADANAVKPNWLALPPEIWERIVEFVFPNIPIEQCMYPKPDARFLGDRYRANSLFTRSLVALALTCKQLNVIALQRVYRAVYLSDREDLDNFVDNLCENGAGLLVPSTCENASWIRAIHMTNTITSESQDEFDADKRRCLCDVHVVLSFADQLRYVSLACEDERRWSLADAVYPGSISNHPLTHFLSTKTRCRPRGLSLSLSGSNGSLDRYIDMNSVTSFAPISQLSHLELIHMLPPDELMAFLIGNPDIADARGYLCELPCSVYDAIAAGLSPRLTLECLRFSHLPRDALYHFRTYVAWRTAEEAFFRLSPEQKALRAMPEPPASNQEQQDFQCALYNLASNSKNLPKLRLIILDFATKEMRVPNEPALDECVRVGLLQHMSATMPGPGRGTKESGRATNSVSPSFERSSAIPRKVIRKLKEADAGWARGLAEADEHWRMVKDGKDALLDLLRSSRQGAASESTDLVQSEVRIAADRNRWTVLTRYERRAEFLGQAASFCHFGSTGHSAEHSDLQTASTNDVGSWADPDVFSLVETMPWLSYKQLYTRGCCVWTGELPRNSNPNFELSGAEREWRGFTHPPVVLLKAEKLDKKGGSTVKGAKTSRAREDEGAEQARSTRQRTDSTAAGGSNATHNRLHP